jgi:hypothetical protein
VMEGIQGAVLIVAAVLLAVKVEVGSRVRHCPIPDPATLFYDSPAILVSIRGSVVLWSFSQTPELVILFQCFNLDLGLGAIAGAWQNWSGLRPFYF